jgi:SAM-dependent methyltransferase
MSTELQRIYATRFPEAERRQRDRLWKTLCADFFQAYIEPEWTVLDLAAGYCEFINNIRCARKIAADLNPEAAFFAAPEVEFVLAASDNLVGIQDATVDCVFVSNFFEHLPNKEIFLVTLREIRRVLRPGGKLLILQPNIRFLHGAYWDFFDHYLPLTDRTMVEALELAEMDPVEVRPRFLPYTTKSRFPQRRALIRLYLKLPLTWRLFGKQAWIVAEKPRRVG